MPFAERCSPEATPLPHGKCHTTSPARVHTASHSLRASATSRSRPSGFDAFVSKNAPDAGRKPAARRATLARRSLPKSRPRCRTRSRRRVRVPGGFRALACSGGRGPQASGLEREGPELGTRSGAAIPPVRDGRQGARQRTTARRRPSLDPSPLLAPAACC
ncbi:hypothetical protein BD310DRAFT_825575 [Dichomitus squalens]|uniref:Uncharacterized protein n=1 Tax=Dichomitus squalens TaxID=114155 RepID=A0A4Q9PMN3_9APHY|nr:hypothetical protein BD310DRAFT_825575 [Dichomitus squalens]